MTVLAFFKPPCAGDVAGGFDAWLVPVRGFLYHSSLTSDSFFVSQSSFDPGLETDVAKHLSQTYGDQSEQVAKMAKVTGKRYPVVGKRLVEEFPYIEAEVPALHFICCVTNTR